MGRLDGKTCIVTAAGQGIGKASALAMAAEGARVLATDINADALAALDAKGLETAQLDVCDAAAVAAFAQGVNPPDVLFNCAGFVDHGSILDCDEDSWSKSMSLNATAMYRLIRTLLPGMISNRRGSIINMSSVASSVIAAPNRFVYGTTKAAVIGMTKAIAADHVADGIRCNAICPGTVDSPSLYGRLRATGDYDAAHAEFVARQPMGRLGLAQEIAALVVYLASDESNFTTGTAQIIDGGWSNI